MYVDSDLRIEIEIDSGSKVGKANISFRPRTEYSKAVDCVINAIREIIGSAGYAVESFSITFTESLIEVVLSFSLTPRTAKSSDHPLPKSGRPAGR